MSKDLLLNVKNLSVSIPTRFGIIKPIENIELRVEAGEIHGLVGESGAGKSTIGAAIMGLLEAPATITNGTIELLGKSLRTLDSNAYHKLRGKRISMIFQDPQTSLNPLLTIGDQLIETICQHRNISIEEARRAAIELLRETGIQNADTRLDDYPHQYSGGMRQRVVISLALCSNPDLIIADEPTTALDMPVQKQMLTLIRELTRSRGVGVILITHDIGVIAQVTDKVTVLRHGRVIEHGYTPDVLGQPTHAYTRQLMAAVPRHDLRIDRFVNIADDDSQAQSTDDWHIPGASAEHASHWLLKVKSQSPGDSASGQHDSILQVSDLSVVFGAKKRWFGNRAGFTALENVSIEVPRGAVLGVIGESGSGKSTLAKAIVGLVSSSNGTMHFDGKPLPDARSRIRTHPARRQIQMVFQDPYSSLNSRRTVEAILAESLHFYGLLNRGQEARKLIASILALVELPQRSMHKYPHQFSGGQRQRIAIARALIAQPSFLICDEPTSALDVSIQAQILNLLKDLQQTLNLSILFISHNLAVVRQMADTIVVLRQGKLVECAENDTFFNNPGHEYSKLLIKDSPSIAHLHTIS